MSGCLIPKTGVFRTANIAKLLVETTAPSKLWGRPQSSGCALLCPKRGEGKGEGSVGGVQLDTHFPHGPDTILFTTKEGALFIIH